MTLHDASSFNVEITLNDWLDTQITAHSFPAWLSFSGNRVLFTPPENTANIPCFTVHHTPVMVSPRFQGNRADDSNYGQWAVSLMDISCWVVKETETDQTEAIIAPYMTQLNYMASLIHELVTKTPYILIKDYDASLTNPANTSYKVNFGGIEGQEVLPDPNPVIARVRILVSYRWILRSS